MGFFGFGKKKEKEQQSAQAEETRLEGRGFPRRAETWPAAWMS